jgi:hypothetical protein
MYPESEKSGFLANFHWRLRYPWQIWHLGGRRRSSPLRYRCCTSSSSVAWLQDFVYFDLLIFLNFCKRKITFPTRLGLWTRSTPLGLGRRGEGSWRISWSEWLRPGNQMNETTL